MKLEQNNKNLIDDLKKLKDKNLQDYLNEKISLSYLKTTIKGNEPYEIRGDSIYLLTKEEYRLKLFGYNGIKVEKKSIDKVSTKEVPCNDKNFNFTSIRLWIDKNGSEWLKNYLLYVDTVFSEASACQKGRKYKEISWVAEYEGCNLFNSKLVKICDEDMGKIKNEPGYLSELFYKISNIVKQDFSFDNYKKTNKEIIDLLKTFKISTCYLIGKGSSIDRLTKEDFDSVSPILCINESIKVIENIEGISSERLFVFQQDELLNDRCKPNRAYWIISKQAYKQSLAKYYDKTYVYDISVLGGIPSSLTASVAIRFASKSGKQKCILYGFDSCLHNDNSYSILIGESPISRRDDGSRFEDYCQTIDSTFKYEHMIYEFREPIKESCGWNIICVCKSGGIYDEKHVNWLFEQVSKNVINNFQFYVLCDKFLTNLYSNIIQIPLKYNLQGWFSKFELFRTDLILKYKSNLYLDLDLVITKKLMLPECSSMEDETIYSVQDWWAANERQTSVMLFKPMQLQHIDVLITQIKEYKTNDQPIITKHFVHKELPFIIRSFKDKKMQINGFGDAMIAVFHGNPKPWDVDLEWIPKIKNEKEIFVTKKDIKLDKNKKMKMPNEMEIIDIDITNRCLHKCSNCTRMCGIDKDIRDMSLQQIDNALYSLRNHKKLAGIIGGEPTMHPQFLEVCKIVNKYRPGIQKYPHQFCEIVNYQREVVNQFDKFIYGKCGLWTTGEKSYKNNYEAIMDTFQYQTVNQHKHAGKHLTIFACRKDFNISDEDWIIMRNNCWINQTWSATINIHGAYFCEVAAVIDKYLNKGDNAWEVSEDWIYVKFEDEKFQNQLKLCEMCGACLPLPEVVAKDEMYTVSKTWHDILKDNTDIPLILIKEKSLDELNEKYVINHDCIPYVENINDRISNNTLATGVPYLVIVCEGYDDYLRYTLPRNIKQIPKEKVYIVTTDNDNNTIQLCKKLGVNILFSKRLHEDGAIFSKGKAINEALNIIYNNDKKAWVLCSDADILLPNDYFAYMNNIICNPGCIYGAMRHMIKDDVYTKEILGLYDKNITHNIYDSYRFGKSENIIVGYYQLFNLSASSLVVGKWYAEDSESAAYDDVTFRESYPKHKQQRSHINVFHLPHDINGNPYFVVPKGFCKEGLRQHGLNWYGRKTPRFYLGEAYD